MRFASSEINTPTLQKRKYNNGQKYSNKFSIYHTFNYVLKLFLFLLITCL
jgi:hypothetical protein